MSSNSTKPTNGVQHGPYVLAKQKSELEPFELTPEEVNLLKRPDLDAARVKMLQLIIGRLVTNDERIVLDMVEQAIAIFEMEA